MAKRDATQSAGARPRGLTTSTTFANAASEQTNAKNSRHTAPTNMVAGHGVGVQLTDAGKGRINLQLVAEALRSEGFDPAVEIARVLNANKLDDRTKVMVCLELLQYQQPKLKAVEQTVKIETSAEQDKQRLAQLLMKAGLTGDSKPGEPQP